MPPSRVINLIGGKPKMSIYRYQQFRKALVATPFKGSYMPYDWGRLPDSLPMDWMAYAEMFGEFSREIANVVNSLTRYTHQLAAWRDVVTGIDNRGRMNATVEFIDPVATVALNLPYVIRSRFIFSVAHLCHQANKAKQGNAWKDDLPLDEEIYFKAADAYGASWKGYIKLKRALERIGARDYQEATGDFRNAYNHRFSPRVVVGQTQFVTRQVNPKTKRVTYSLGFRDPMSLDVAVELLERQCSFCYEAFRRFQKLIAEHEGAISAALVASA